MKRQTMHHHSSISNNDLSDSNSINEKKCQAQSQI